MATPTGELQAGIDPFGEFEPILPEHESGLTDAVTGKGGESIDTKGLPELPTSGLLHGEDQAKVAAITPVLLTTTDPEEIAKIITSNFPSVSVQYNKAPDGSVYPILANSNNGANAVVNRAGMSEIDVIQTLGLASAYSPAGATKGFAGQVLGSAATGGAIEGAQQVAGGDFDKWTAVTDAGLAALFRGAENVIMPLYHKMKGTPPQGMQDVIDFAKEHNLPIHTSDTSPPRTFPAKAAVNTGEKVPVTGTGGMRNKQYEARQKLVDKVGDKYGDPNPDEIFQSLKDHKSKFHNAAGKRYQQISGDMADTVIDPVNTVSVVDQQLRKLTQEGRIQNPNLAKKLEEVAYDLLGGDQTFELLKQNRTSFREKIVGDSMKVSDTESRIIDSVYDAMTKDLYESVSDNLGPQVADKWKQANRIYRHEADTIKKTKLKNIFDKGDVTPELVNSMLFSGKKSEVKELFASLTPKGRRAARSGLISKAIEKSKGSPDVFVNELKKLENSTNIFFRGTDRRFIEGVKSYLNTTKRSGQAGVATKTGQENLQVGGLLGMGYDLSSTGGKYTGLALAYGAMARGYESKKVRDLLYRIAQYSKYKKDLPPEAIALGKELTSVLQSFAQTQSQQEGSN